MSLKLLKISAIMDRFNCTKDEAITVKCTGVAPISKKVTIAVVPKKKKKEIQVDTNHKEVD